MAQDAHISEKPAKHRHLIWLGVFAGLVLCVIGARFLLVPDQAVRTFGLGKGVLGHELHAIIGLRDLWLGGLAILLAWFKEWRALAIWLTLGAMVCLADALIVASSSGKAWAVGFHVGSGVFCGWLALACWRAWSRRDTQGEFPETDGPPAA